MGETELFISGIGVSRRVVSQVVTMAVEEVEGVVRVGGNDIASSLRLHEPFRLPRGGRRVPCRGRKA